jgi:PiT family inorganic phosphate transporter
VLRASGAVLSMGQLAACRDRGRAFGFDAGWLLDRLHFLSAGMVGFARGLNDTPKIVALLAAGAGLGLTPASAILVVSGAMAAGGIVASRRVATTMSERIASMNHGQGFTANLVTAFLVFVPHQEAGASKTPLLTSSGGGDRVRLTAVSP